MAADLPLSGLDEFQRIAVFAEQKNATQHVAAAAATGEGTVEDLPPEAPGGGLPPEGPGEGPWLCQGRSWGRPHTLRSWAKQHLATYAKVSS